MANSSDLDDFFKKKDRKSNKNKKQSGILTNNEELLKQLVSVTTATTAFKDNFDFADEEEDGFVYDENNRPPIESVTTTTSAPKTSQTMKIKAADGNADRLTSNNQQQPQTSSQQQQQQQQQQDEWEEFVDPNWKYEEMRARYARSNPNDDDYEDGDNSDDSMSRDENNHNFDQREQQKDKPAWKLDQIKSNEINNQADPKEEVRAPSPVQAPVAAYRPPQRRNPNSTTGEVTIISGSQQRPTARKKQPNLASTEEFPSLGAAVAKK